ncbi:MAG: ribosome-associated translation inhibitor RaiA [Patescibacteria group bacterium]|jgi:ribosomal subunit interface protein
MIISAKNIKLTTSLKTYAEEKLYPLHKLSRQPITEMKVRLDFDRNQHSGDIYRVEASVLWLGKTYKAGVKADDMYEAIDLVKEKLERQLRDAKELWLSKRAGHHGL